MVIFKNKSSWKLYKDRKISKSVLINKSKHLIRVQQKIFIILVYFLLDLLIIFIYLYMYGFEQRQKKYSNSSLIIQW